MKFLKLDQSDLRNFKFKKGKEGNTFQLEISETRPVGFKKFQIQEGRRVDRWRKIKRHGKMKYCVLSSPNDHRRWTNTILEHLAIVTKIIFITSIGLVSEGLMELIDGAK